MFLVKSNNILLDRNWNVKVSDFGLAKLLGSEKSYVTTRVMGTFGYVSPDYASTGMLNEGSDVYSFGVLLMEIITGRSPVDYSRAPGELYAYLFPILLFLLYYYRQRDPHDLHYAVLGVLYSGLVTAVITDTIKDAVGRPRPNFFFRCFPEGLMAFKENGDVLCNGDSKIIKEGYKSFPSGHSSWSFAGLGFLGLYLSGKIRAFDRRGHAAKLCIILPYLLAALVGVSCVDD